MAYAAITDMAARFSEQDLILLTRRPSSDPNQINEPVLEQALTDASAEINSYLAGRYQLPLTTVPEALPRVCCDLARYFLAGQNAPDHITQRYRDAIAWLRSVNKGDIALGIDQSGGNAQQHDMAEMESAGSVFSRRNTGGFI